MLKRLYWLPLLLLALPASSLGQPPVPELRARAAALRVERPASVPLGTITSIEHMLDVSERIEERYPTQSVAWRTQAARFLDSVESGRDPYPEGRGQILNRGYDASFTPTRQGYAIYLPPDYTPDREWPMLIMLHGGSSNGNLFLGVVLGNNMSWERYHTFWWNDFTPQWSPEWIVVAPTGVGQPIYRWMGEQDVLEVLRDVRRHYSVDENRVVLGGLSNGGMGAYSIGARHAWRFSYVQAMAGAPSWLQYAGGRPTNIERTVMLPYSAMHLFENTVNTNFHYFHGTEDGGPMRPDYVRELTRYARGLGLTPNDHWYDHGHDLLYLVHRHGRVYDSLAEIVRDPHPHEVRVVTGDYRANRQHWVTVTRIERYPELATVRATAQDGLIEATTENVLELVLRIDDAPLGDSAETRIVVDDHVVYSGPRAALGHLVHAFRDDAGEWALGFLPPPEEGLQKVPGLSGPLGDAYHEDIIHVYGTQNAQNERALRRTAELGASGWASGTWNLGQRVIPDTDLTDELIQQHHIALYGSPGDNLVLDRIADRLPIRAEGNAVVTDAGESFRGNRVGARFIYPNPEAPHRYVLVNTGVSAQAISSTRNLPDFLPDYVIYDASSTRSRERLITRPHRRHLREGFFDRFWELTPPVSGSAADAQLPPGVSREEMRRLALLVGAPEDFILPSALFQQEPPPRLGPGELPAAPARPRRFLAPRTDPNGPIARTIAQLVPTFYNYRAMIPGGVWDTHRGAVWSVRPEQDCLDALDEAGVRYQRVTEDLETPIPTPVEIRGTVGGVRFGTARAGDRIIISCELATRLPLLTRIARRQRVTGITILSSHRASPRQSFHRMGMALDIFSFTTARGEMTVLDDFIETPAATTCDAPEPSDWRARALLQIACDLSESHRFNSILTPNYNDGHRNHFHVDVRPDDNRIFTR